MVTARYQHIAALLPDGSLLVAGGTDGAEALASAELYDPASGTWAATGNMIEGRDYHAVSLLVDDTVLLAGGAPFFVGDLSSAELYDLETGTWTATGSLITARSRHAATLLPDGTVLLAGGMAGGQPLSSAELYTP